MKLYEYIKPFLSLSLRMLTVITSFLFSWIVARLFGAKDAGTLFFYVTIITIVVTLSCQGADLGIAKAVARIKNGEQDKIHGLYKYVVSNSIKGYIIISPLYFGFLVYEGYDVKTVLILYLLLFVVGLCFLYMNIISYLYQGLGSIFLMILSQRTLFNFLSFLLMSIIWLVFILFNYNLNLIDLNLQISIVMFSSVAAALFFFVLYNSNIKSSSDKFEPIGFRDSSKDLFRIQALQLVTMYGSQIIINFFSSKSDIAGFIISQRISTLLGFFVLAISSVISSRISRAHASNDLNTVKKQAYQSVIFASSLGVPIGILLIIFSQEFLSLFGHDFIQFRYVLIILVFSQIINCLTGACDFVLMFIDGEKEHKVNVLIGTSFAIFLSLILIPTYAALGAAIAAAVSATIVNILDVISIRKKAGFWVFSAA